MIAIKAQSPIVSESETPEQAAAYERWLRERVAASLADKRPVVPHDEAVARARALIEARRGVLRLVWRAGALDDLTTVIGYIAERDLVP